MKAIQLKIQFLAWHKLASLEATLGVILCRPSHQLTGPQCRATGVAKKLIQIGITFPLTVFLKHGRLDLCLYFGQSAVTKQNDQCLAVKEESSSINLLAHCGHDSSLRNILIFSTEHGTEKAIFSTHKHLPSCVLSPKICAIY